MQMFGARTSQAESTSARTQGGTAQAYVSVSKANVAAAGSRDITVHVSREGRTLYVQALAALEPLTTKQ